MSAQGQAAPVGRRARRLIVTVVLLLLAGQVVNGWPWLISTFDHFQTPQWPWFVLALVVDVASMGAYARMQRRLLRVGGTAVSLPSAAALAYASHSLSDTLPGGPAFSAVFSFRRMRHLGASAGSASWVIAFSGAVSAGALIAIGVVAGLLATGDTDAASLVAYGTLVALLVLGVLTLKRHPGLVAEIATRSLAFGNRLLRHDPQRGAARFHGLIADVSAVRIRPVDLAVTLTLAVVNWLLDALCLYLCMVAVGVESASPVAVLLAYTAGMAALSVPLVPGGLGVVDAALVLGLVAGGTSPADAIAATILFRVITLGMIIGAGWVVWSFTRHPRPDLEQAAPSSSGFPPSEHEVGQGADRLDGAPEHPGSARATDGACGAPGQVT